MKHIDVTCAIIEKDTHILIAQRSESMSMPLKWEFPGGKIQAGEPASDSIIREIREELCLDIRILAPLPPSTHQYPNLQVTLHPFICTPTSNTITLTEHADCQWLSVDDVSSYDLAEADIPVLQSYRVYKQQESEFPVRQNRTSINQ